MPLEWFAASSFFGQLVSSKTAKRSTIFHYVSISQSMVSRGAEISTCRCGQSVADPTDV